MKIYEIKKLNQKVILIVALMLLLVLGGMLPVFSSALTHAAATLETLEEKCARYTSNDMLADGSEDIETFAFRAKSRVAPGHQYPALQYVIPIEYLRYNSEKPIYQYMGKEYGFIVEHSNNKNCLNVFLIDFEWNDDVGNIQNLEKGMKVVPLLCETFIYDILDGHETWVVNGGVERKFALANIEFNALLLNENALNYGDSGYNKQDDKGLIIQQERISYSGSQFARGDWLSEAAQFLVDTVLGHVDNVSRAYDILKTSYSLLHIIKTSQYSEIRIYNDVESNIKTFSSKSAQLHDENQQFTRAYSIKSPSEILMFSAERQNEQNSYAQCITMMNETNYRSRLIQQITFQIVTWDNGKIVNFNGNDTYTTYREEVIYDDQEPISNLYESTMTSPNINVYLLPYGKQYIYFTPRQSDQYKFSLPPNVTIGFDGQADIQKENGISYVNLHNGQTYKLVVTNHSNFNYAGVVIELNAAAHTPAYYNVTLNYNGGYVQTTSNTYFERVITVQYGNKLSLSSAYIPKRNGYDFDGFFTTSGEQYYDGWIEESWSAGQQFCVLRHNPTREWDITGNTTLIAHWKPLETNIFQYSLRTEDYSKYSTSDILHVTHGNMITLVAPESFENHNFSRWTDGKGNTLTTSRTLNYTVSLQRQGIGNVIEVTTSPVAVYSEKEECVAEGTMITLSDGTQKAVETLTGDEQLLVWDLKTGRYDSAPILFIDSEPQMTYEVINLTFSDGTVVKVISEHGFWDYNLNRYVYLDKTASQYVGHWFNKIVTDENGNIIATCVKLVEVTLQNEITTAYSPVTYGHLCYYVNGMLSMPGGINGLFNIFEVDSETMRYNETTMQSDIEHYGLFTYTEFLERFSISENIFEAFNGQYLKIAIGKGLITEEQIIFLIQRYSTYFD